MGVEQRRWFTLRENDWKCQEDYPRAASLGQEKSPWGWNLSTSTLEELSSNQPPIWQKTRQVSLQERHVGAQVLRCPFTGLNDRVLTNALAPVLYLPLIFQFHEVFIKERLIYLQMLCVSVYLSVYMYVFAMRSLYNNDLFTYILCVCVPECMCMYTLWGLYKRKIYLLTYFMCVCVPECICMCTSCVQVPVKAREGRAFSEWDLLELEC